MVVGGGGGCGGGGGAPPPLLEWAQLPFDRRNMDFTVLWGKLFAKKA